MLGQRIEPMQYHPLADELDGAQLDGFMSDIRTLVSRATRTLPTHEEFVRRTFGTPVAADVC